jgi:phage baseplate assembly protein gpV
MPVIGELVAVLLDNAGESGVVLGGIYSQNDSAPAIAQNELHIITGTVVITGDLVITGDTNHTGTITITGSGNTINGKEICVVGGLDNAGHLNQISGQ